MVSEDIAGVPQRVQAAAGMATTVTLLVPAPERGRTSSGQGSDSPQLHAGYFRAVHGRVRGADTAVHLVLHTLGGCPLCERGVAARLPLDIT